MSARHALLGLLRERPAYPYELVDRLGKRLGPAWAINSGQVYQTIKSLEKDGLVEPVQDVTREDREFRAITSQGEAEQDAWLARRLRAVRPARQPFIVKLALGGPERLAKNLGELDALEQEYVEQVLQIVALMDAVPVEGLRVRADHVALRLSLTSDLYQVEAYLSWVRYARETVKRLAGQDAIWIAGGQVGGEERSSGSSAARAELLARLAARDRPVPIEGQGVAPEPVPPEKRRRHS